MDVTHYKIWWIYSAETFMEAHEGPMTDIQSNPEPTSHSCSPAVTRAREVP